jgi:hypothetical protein
MGTWGPGNFDDDTAADHLSIVTARLVDEITTAMAGAPGDIEPDEYGGSSVPCNVELLALIAEQHWTGATLPEPATVQSWKETYLSTWDGYIDQLQPKAAWKRQRRGVLVKTFERLLRASTKRHGPAKVVAKKRSPPKGRKRSTR